MTTITLTRALSKIKTLTASIEKSTNNYRSDKTDALFLALENNSSKEDFIKANKNVTANFNSIQDRLNLITKLKLAIAKKNLETEVTVIGKSMTITEVLAIKENLSLYKSFLTKLQEDFSAVRDSVLNLKNVSEA